MRYLILSDIHSNLTALDAVLAAAKGRWEKAVCLGDIVGYGPDPNEVVERVRSLDAVVMAGFPQGYEDLAPLPVIMAEAGGRITDLSGGPVLAGDGTALVSTGPLHDQLLSLVAGLPHGPRPA